MRQSLGSAELLHEMASRGYAEVDHGVPDEAVEELIVDYTDFTRNYPDPEPSTMCAMLPPAKTADDIRSSLDVLDRSQDTQKPWHKYRTNIQGRGKPDGYTSRSFQERALSLGYGIKLDEDPKEYYHHTPAHLAAMQTMHRERQWGPLPPEVIKLDHSFSIIHDKMVGLMLRVCSALEESHPGLREVVDARALQMSPLRLLFYHPSTCQQLHHPSEHQQLAAGHYDKSVFTVQIAESHQGLRVATTDDQPLMPVIRDSHLGVLFAGYRHSAPRTDTDVGGHFPDSPLRPAWHDVIYTPETNNGRSIPPSAIEVCARWSLIFFASERNFIEPGKVLMHRRNTQ